MVKVSSTLTKKKKPKTFSCPLVSVLDGCNWSSKPNTAAQETVVQQLEPVPHKAAACFGFVLANRLTLRVEISWSSGKCGLPARPRIMTTVETSQSRDPLLRTG